MGIRINKKLGWILKNFKGNLKDLDYSLKDLVDENPNDEELKMDLSINHKLDLKSKVTDFIDILDDKILIITPPGLENWKRHDSPIDYYENQNTGKTKIRFLHQPIYPFLNKHVSVSTNQILPESIRDICLWNLNQSFLLKKETVDKMIELGIDPKKSLKPQIYMICPKVIELMFKKISKKDYKKLRPAILTYWR